MDAETSAGLKEKGMRILEGFGVAAAYFAMVAALVYSVLRIGGVW